MIRDLLSHIHKSRPPEIIVETVSHFVGEAEGTRINTGIWANLRDWFYQNQNRPNLRVFAVCEDLQQPDVYEE